MRYAGIGSRKTPDDICKEMRHIAYFAAQNDHTLSTGAAIGADQAFMRGACPSGSAEIYLPWWSYESQSWNRCAGFTVTGRPSDTAERIAAYFHPNWGACSSAVRALHARNTHIIMGADCESPVDLIVCYTPGGEATGGTGQALRLARANNIPVIDLGAPEPWATLLESVYAKFRKRRIESLATI